MLLAFGMSRVIFYKIKWLKAIAVSPHREEASWPLLHVCCVNECVYIGSNTLQCPSISSVSAVILSGVCVRVRACVSVYVCDLKIFLLL